MVFIGASLVEGEKKNLISPNHTRSRTYAALPLRRRSAPVVDLLAAVRRYLAWLFLCSLAGLLPLVDGGAGSQLLGRARDAAVRAAMGSAAAGRAAMGRAGDAAGLPVVVAGNTAMGTAHLLRRHAATAGSPTSSILDRPARMLQNSRSTQVVLLP